MSGAEVLAELQASEATRCIPTVIVTADATAGQLERLMNAGARDYITKPIDISHFYHVMEESVSGREEHVIA
jgi:CheY-like chemotaxis protein